MKPSWCRIPVLAALVPALFAALAAAAGPAAACTVFCMQQGGELVVGRNYDWEVDAGLVLVNKRQMAKTFDLAAEPGGAGWTSRYGSLTFNQYGRDLPQGGINEKGLVVEILWLAGTEFPPPDERPGLAAVQWIQYQLDMSATVPEVLASLDRVRIRSTVEVHFFVSDREGRSASVEFLEGRPVCHTGDAMPAPTLTNHSYDASVEFLRRHRGWGGTSSPSPGSRSLDRFVRASTEAAAYDPGRDGEPVAYAHRVLAEVAQGEHTKWSIVYDQRRRRVHYRTHRRAGITTVDLDRLDFDCARPVLMTDINGEPAASGRPRWLPYTREANLELITHSYRHTDFLADTPRETIERVASYPERSSCVRRLRERESESN